MERVRIGKDIVFQWEVRKDGAALTAEDAANLTLEIAGRNGKSQRLPFEIRDSKIIAAWYGVRQTEIGAYRLTCWHNRGKVGESVVDVVWAVELVRYTTEETFDDIETVTIELDGGNLTFGVLKGASAYEVAVAEGFVGTEAEWIASLKKPAEDAAADAEEAAARAINAAVEATESAENAQTEAGNARAAGDYAYEMANNAEAKAQLADAAADNANTAATEAYSKAQEADTAATTATNAAQSANSAAASANEAANSAVNAAVEATESAENAQTEAGNAHNAANYANEMAIAAERVNAQLNGNILTVTNRQGTSTSVNTKGEQGEQGNPGQAATISVGTTTTGAPGTDAQVTNSGTSSAAVLNFTIPKGDKGDQGEPGEVTEAEMNAALALKEDKTNKVTEIDDDSTDVQYPSAKGVWTAIKNAIAAIKQWATSLFARTDGWYSRMIVGGAESLIGDVPQTATYTFRRTGGGAIGEPVARLTEIQGNTGVVNQQLRNLDNAYWGGYNVAELAFSDGEVVFTPNADGLSSYVHSKNSVIQNVTGHKYYVGMKAKRDTAGNVILRLAAGYIYGVFSVTDTYARYASIVICTGNGYSNTNWIVGNNAGVKTYIKDVQLFDLTLMYGAGNEPGTVAEFEARIWRDYGKTLDEYIAYTTGKLINCKAVALESYNTDSELLDTINLNLTTLTGINPTTGVRETIFPNGMRSKGDVRDVISGNTATVKIGDPAQEAPLENTVLATPIVYTDIQFADDTPFVLPKNYEVQNDGTERITHAEGEDSIAPVMSAIYGLNAVGFVQDAPKDYTSQATLDALLSALSSVTGHTFTKTWDAANNKWVFS